ncbi:hypothetical protein [Streptomyces nojiriensis]|uniref:hypothetical protein n=1 Tax=Streptomyces nojiriensis TaxID=66374 RepID=UPI001675D4DC|nr:hypothetical protein [Streptomyces nojiriensis]
MDEFRPAYGARSGLCAGRLLALGEDDRFGGWGELYAVADRLARFGRMPEAMENLVLGVMPARVATSGRGR